MPSNSHAVFTAEYSKHRRWYKVLSYAAIVSFVPIVATLTAALFLTLINQIIPMGHTNDGTFALVSQIAPSLEYINGTPPIIVFASACVAGAFVILADSHKTKSDKARERLTTLESDSE